MKTIKKVSTKLTASRTRRRRADQKKKQTLLQFARDWVVYLAHLALWKLKWLVLVDLQFGFRFGLLRLRTEIRILRSAIRVGSCLALSFLAAVQELRADLKEGK